MTHTSSTAKVTFSNKILILGFGSIGSSSLPVLLRHLECNTNKIHIISKDSNYWHVAESYGISYDTKTITQENYKKILSEFNLASGDFVINLTVDVSSKDILLYCNSIGALYIDTCVEPWAGVYTDKYISNSEKSNYALREKMLELKPQLKDGPTAIIAHGANPGMVNHFVKRALVELSKKTVGDFEEPTTQSEWAAFAKNLGVSSIQISERDTQISSFIKHRNEFHNTWSVDGFISEGIFQPAELGWGSHEETMPANSSKHDFGCDAAIYINTPGASVKVKGWTPDEGPYHGFLVTHNESISIANYFTLNDNSTKEVVYRPTVYYCYHPCDAAVLSVHEILGRNNIEQDSKHIMLDDIVSGVDELGVLLLGDFGEFTGYWHGSNLSIEQAREIAPYNSATSLQVVAGVVSAFIWAVENPTMGLVEPDDIDYKRILEIADQYLGKIVSMPTSWVPKESNNVWQFENFLV